MRLVLQKARRQSRFAHFKQKDTNLSRHAPRISKGACFFPLETRALDPDDGFDPLEVQDAVFESDEFAAFEKFRFGNVAYTSAGVFWLQCSAESAQISRESNSEPIR